MMAATTNNDDEASPKNGSTDPNESTQEKPVSKGVSLVSQTSKERLECNRKILARQGSRQCSSSLTQAHRFQKSLF